MEKLHEMIRELLNDEVYDMMDDFSEDLVVKVVAQAVMGLRIFNVFSFKLGDFRFKLSNYNKSVSCSDDSCTGVSRTQYKVYWEEDDDFNRDAVKNLIEMINESYYHCVN